MSRIWHVLAWLLLVSSAQAEETLKTSLSWDGGEIYYPAGEPEITSVILEIKQGELPPFHCHPVPTLGYIRSGTVELETIDGKKKTLNTGDSAVEAMRTVHRGRAIGGDVEIVVFYVGEKSTPNTVLPEHDLANQYCNSANHDEVTQSRQQQ